MTAFDPLRSFEVLASGRCGDSRHTGNIRALCEPTVIERLWNARVTLLIGPSRNGRAQPDDPTNRQSLPLRAHELIR
jgi:hypothetical protein